MRFLILFIFLITSALAEKVPGIKNIVVHKELKTYDNVIFLNKNNTPRNRKNFYLKKINDRHYCLSLGRQLK